MIYNQYYLRVRKEHIDTFIEATVKKAEQSVREAGCLRYELFQDSKDTSRFMLVEAFRDDQSEADHHRTAHFFRWRDATRETYSTIDSRGGSSFKVIFSKELAERMT